MPRSRFVETDIPNSYPADTFAGCSLKTGSVMSRIVGSDAGSPLRLRVANIGPLDDIAPEPSACEINVPGTHALFVDYSRAAHGTNDSAVVGFDERVTLDADDTGRPLRRYV